MGEWHATKVPTNKLIKLWWNLKCMWCNSKMSLSFQEMLRAIIYILVMMRWGYGLCEQIEQPRRLHSAIEVNVQVCLYVSNKWCGINDGCQEHEDKGEFYSAFWMSCRRRLECFRSSSSSQTKMKRNKNLYKQVSKVSDVEGSYSTDFVYTCRNGIERGSLELHQTSWQE